MRVLNALSDSDRSDEHLAALELHRALAAAGVDVRTVALGPGRTGGLDAVIPVIAPSPGALAAHTELRREARWATVVLVHGPTALKVARRSVRRATVIAVGATTPPIGIDAGAGAVDPRPRTVARDAFGLDPAALAVVALVTPRPAAEAAQLRATLGDALCVPVLLPDGPDDEMVWSAADVALDLTGPRDGQIPQRVLRAMASGIAVAVPERGDGAGVRTAGDTVEWCSVERIRAAVGLLADPAARAAVAATARVEVEQQWTWAARLGPWLDLLGGASAPLPGDAGRP